MVVKIALINIAKRKKIKDVINWASDQGISIICLTEAPESVTYDGDHELIIKQGKDFGVAAVILDHQLVYKTPYVKRTHLVLKLVGSIMIHLWYLSPSKKTDEELELASLLEKPTKSVIHLGDMNARTRALERTDNQRGRNLADAAERGKFRLLNEPGIPTYTRHGNDSHTSIIDWVLITEDLVPNTKLEVLPPISKLDHSALLITLSTREEVRNASKKVVVAPAPFLSKIQQITTDDETDDWFGKLMEAVKYAQKVRQKKKHQPLTEELKALRNQINQLMKQIRQSRGTDTHLWKQCKEMQALYKEKQDEAEIEAGRQTKWKLTTTLLFKECKAIQKRAPKVTYVQRGDEQVRGNEACQILLDHFYPLEETEDVIVPEDLPPNDPPLTSVEVETALSHFEKNSAPGHSGVSFDLLKKWYALKKGYFTKLFSEWYNAGQYPDELKRAMVIGLTKNKSQPPTPENVRLITLTETIARWYERIVDTRLIFILEEKKMLSPDQFGFRPGMSAEDAAVRLREIRDRNKGKVELVIQTDVSKAFDKLSHKAIVQTLVDKKLPGNMIRIIASFISERQTSMMLGEDWVTTQIRRGVPQGSCLGPHLYVLTTNLMLETLREQMNNAGPTTNELVAFADDVVVVSAARKDNWSTGVAENLIESMKNELAKVGLTMSETKLKFMMRGSAQTSKIVWKGSERDLEESMKILGVTFGRDNDFDKHVTEMEQKAAQFVRDFNSLIYSGLPFERRQTLAKTMMIPSLLYGAQTWYPKTKRDQRQTLERMTRVVGKVVTGAPENAGKAAVALMSKMLPFHLQVRAKSLLHDELQRAKERMEATAVDYGHPSTWKQRTFGATIDTDELVRLVNADVYLFTDGSRFTDDDGTHVGAAVVEVVPLDDETESIQTVVACKLGESNTVFEAEMTAIKEAALKAASYPPGKKVAIMTDSLSSLCAIKSPTPRSKLTIACQKAIDATREKGIELTLHHVKAHVGVSGNESADAAAKHSATTGDMCVVPKSRTTMKRKIEQTLYDQFDMWYKSDKSGRTIKQFFDGPFDPALKKAKIAVHTAAFYSGHSWNLESMRFGYKGAQVNCRCGPPQSTVHVLTNCKLYMAENIRAAQAAGISIDEFLRPWQELKNHSNFHWYVNSRALPLSRQLMIDNLPHCEMESLRRAFYRLSTAEDSDLPEEPLEEPDQWPPHSDRFLSAFDVKTRWHVDVEWKKWW